MARAESHLLGFGKEVIGIAIQHHFAHHLQRYKLLGNELCGVQNIEVKAVCKLLVKDLEAEFKFRKIARCDRLPQVSTMKIGVGTVNLDGLVPQHGTGPQFRSPVKLNELSLSVLADQPESVNPKSLHHSIGPGYGPI